MYLFMNYYRIVEQLYRDLLEEDIDLWHANKQNSQKNFGFIPSKP